MLSLAREAISDKLARGSAPVADVADAALRTPRGAFVSLHIDGALRGCIGTLYADKPLHETVSEMAAKAATADPRFAPLSPRELRSADIEISVLTPFTPIAPEDVEVGRHGLYIARGRRRGVLLPQVPVQFGWDRETFLAQVCRKAGLDADAWGAADTILMAFEAQVFSDLGELEEG
ncbi:MAG: AMMECR1 domain-containing protein [Proteobacteria bacterium]|nr:MAG: AMMECR1 domain-containing protein [Pseudomonadota bacterium]